MGIFSGGEVSRDEFERLARRVEELERRLASMTSGAAATTTEGHDVPSVWEDPAMARVRDLKQRGKLVEAIKVYRQVTGAGLRQAKLAVERM